MNPATACDRDVCGACALDNMSPSTSGTAVGSYLPPCGTVYGAAGHPAWVQRASVYGRWAAVFPQGSSPWGLGRDSVLPLGDGVSPIDSAFRVGGLAVSLSAAVWDLTGLKAEPPVEAAACCHRPFSSANMPMYVCMRVCL